MEKENAFRREPQAAGCGEIAVVEREPDGAMADHAHPWKPGP